MNVNKTFLAGRLTRDPQLRYLPSQTAVVEFGMAVNWKFTGRDGQVKEKVLFVDVRCFGPRAVTINEHFHKSKEIYIEGRLEYETWEDKQGGGKRSKHLVTAENFEFVGAPSDESGDSPRRQQPAAGAGRQLPPPTAKPSEEAFQEADIPF